MQLFSNHIHSLGINCSRYEISNHVWYNYINIIVTSMDWQEQEKKILLYKNSNFTLDLTMTKYESHKA